MSRALVTGASGFVGRTLCGALAGAGYSVRAAVRRGGRVPAAATESAEVQMLGPDTDWSAALQGVDVVVHLAARAHVMRDSRDNDVLYERANAAGTFRLATQCAARGVRRFVFMSSVKVNGEETIGPPFTYRDRPMPADAYGESKLRGEMHAIEVGRETGMEVAVIRSPLMYGPGVKGNFLRLMRWVDQERALPFGRVVNQRSLINVWNLCDLVCTILARPQATGRVWMAADREDLSTPELVRRIACAMERRARLIAVPVPLLLLGGAMIGRYADMKRLCGSLIVDAADTRRELAWSPPLGVDEALRRTAEWFRSERIAHAA